ncbi:MAG: hypothetical protein Q8R78_03705 [Candidatus Omnitrophota bacterium]|nr:hypothetical protein [Candidatus Omnitrophota bacterium]
MKKHLIKSTKAFFFFFFIAWVITTVMAGSVSFDFVDETGQTAPSSGAFYLGLWVGLIFGSCGAISEWRTGREMERLDAKLAELRPGLKSN